MARLLTCPHCGHDRVLRSRSHTALELLANLAFYSPFHCQSCSHRFMASRLAHYLPDSFVDRRRHLRIPVRLFLSFSGGRIKGEGTVLDISMGGCMIQSDAPVHVNDIFYLQIMLGAQEAPLELAAMVRSVGSRGISFKFLRAAQDNKRLLAFVQGRRARHAHKA